MFRLTQSGKKFYAKEIDSVEDDMEDIATLVMDGDAVILVDDLEMYEIDDGSCEIFGFPIELVG